MFEKIKAVFTKEAIKDLVNTPAPIGKTVLIGGAIVVTAFLLTHRMKIIIIIG